tara:strand:+ start:6012 stop:6290 length:279 start_codon:yes stop_codon:yes gene_type:complete
MDMMIIIIKFYGLSILGNAAGTNQSAFNLFRTGFWSNSINGVEHEDRASFWTTNGCKNGNNYLINLSKNGFTIDVGCTSAGNVKPQVRCIKD